MNKLFALLSVFALGCGGTSTDTDAGGTPDGSNPTDTGVKSDTGASDSGIQDTGSDTNMNPFDGSGPMDGGIECMNPTTCMNGNTYCCATVTAGSGQPPNCFFNGTYSTKCTMTCNSNFNAQCNSMSTRRLCNMKSQCTENTYNQCCTVMLNNQSVSLCMSTQEAAIAQASCL